MNRFWKWAKDEVSTNGSDELIFEGVIASESWWGDEVTPQALRDELNAQKGDITVRINSPGGDVYAGISIYNMLSEYDGNVTIIVDSLAASAASFIAMAGDKIVMNAGSMMMIHYPWQMAVGNSEDLRQAADYLDKVGQNIASLYAARTGKSEEDINALLEAETWMTAEEAVEMGFADEAIPAKNTLSNALKNALSYTESVNAAVMQPVMSLKTKLEATPQAELSVSKPKEVKETDVTDTTKTADEVVQPSKPDEPAKPAEPEAPAPTEPEPKDQAIKPVAKKEEVMSTATKEIAKDQVIAPENQATPDQKPKVKDYLKSKQSVNDFADVLRANAGKSFNHIHDAWKEILVKNGLTDADYFLPPEPVITSINDAIKTSGIYNLLNKTGLDVMKAVWDDADEFADTSRAGGHKKGDTKDEQILDFDNRVLRPGVIYKYLVLDKQTIREQKSTGALVRFVLNELPTRIIREIERAVMIGDGRTTGNKRHIASYISVKSDVVAGNAFADEYVPAEGESLAESVARAKDLLLADGTVVMVAKKGFGTTARFEKDTDGRLLFPLGTKATDVFDVDTVIEPTWFTDATDPDYDAYLVVFSQYNTVGDNSIEAFTNFKLETNENEFLQELYQGGGLVARKAAVGIASASNS